MSAVFCWALGALAVHWAVGTAVCYLASRERLTPAWMRTAASTAFTTIAAFVSTLLRRRRA
ncbi:hypothetical protein [Streptomyces sp. C10-9-1]|uniref:hypothetical protein n=1 Tax=Streptomyces sp. C10-9-1 TaxID=1859285 RepID=UPI003F49EEDC